MSATARKRKEEVAQALKKLIQAKGKTPAMKYQQLFDDLRGQSEAVSVPQIFPPASRMNTSRLTRMKCFVFVCVPSPRCRPSPRTCLTRRSEL